VLGHPLVLIPLHLEPPLHHDRLATRWEIDEAPGVVLLDGCHLLHHHLPPTWIALGLGEVGRLIESHHVQVLDHQCTWLKPDHHDDVIDATKVKLRIMIVVGVEVVVIINLRIVVLSIEVVVIDVIVNLCIVIHSMEH
jgi:hypothetical protein